MPRGSFAPGEPIGSGFSALIFFGSFLYQDKKERLAGFSPKFCSRLIVSKLFRPFRACKIIRSIQGAEPLATYSAPSGLVKNCSLRTRGCAPCYLFRPFRACKIIRSIQGAEPLATYFAPLGLKPPDRFWNPPGGGQVPPVGGQV